MRDLNEILAPIEQTHCLAIWDSNSRITEWKNKIAEEGDALDVNYLEELIEKEYIKMHLRGEFLKDLEKIRQLGTELDEVVKEDKDDKLTPEKVSKICSAERTHKPDWDDVVTDFEFANGLSLTMGISYSLTPCTDFVLEGVDGYIYIEKMSELKRLLRMTWTEILDEISVNEEDFDRSEWE